MDVDAAVFANFAVFVAEAVFTDIDSATFRVNKFLNAVVIVVFVANVTFGKIFFESFITNVFAVVNFCCAGVVVRVPLSAVVAVKIMFTQTFIANCSPIYKSDGVDVVIIAAMVTRIKI